MFTAWETPRRVFEYNQSLVTSHQVGTIGAFVLGLSFLIMFYNLGKSYVAGPDAPDNPWKNTRSAEWTVPSPPPLENWAEGRPSYASGKLEFLDRADDHTTATDGGHAAGNEASDYVLGDKHHSHASIWPIAVSGSVLALLLGLSGIAGSLSIDPGASVMGVGVALEGNPLYPLFFVVGLVGLLYTSVKWALEDFYAPPAAIANRWPFDHVEKNKLGMWFFLASDVLVFGAFISAAVFIRVNAGWTSWDPLPASLPGLINTFVLLTSSFTVILALAASRRKSRKGLMAGLGATIILGLTFLGIKAWEWHHEIYDVGITLSQNPAHGPPIQATIYYVTTGLHGIHVIIGLIASVFLLVRAYKGYYLEDHRPVEYFGLYWHFVDIVWVFLFPLFYLF
jgi:cytochrome c oxidase subunit I+III